MGVSFERVDCSSALPRLAGNRVLFALGRLVPPGIIAKMLHGRWRAAQKKWLDSGAQAQADTRRESVKACGI